MPFRCQIIGRLCGRERASFPGRRQLRTRLTEGIPQSKVVCSPSRFSNQNDIFRLSPKSGSDFLPDHANLVAGVYRPDIPDTIRSVLVLFVPEAGEYCGCCHAHKDWPTHESAPETEGPGYLVIVNERKRRSRYRCGLGRLGSLYPGPFRRRYLLSQAYANHSRSDFPASREPHSRLTPWVVAASWP